MSGDRLAELEKEVNALNSMVSTLVVAHLRSLNAIRAVITANKLNGALERDGKPQDAFGELGKIFDEVYEELQAF